MPIQAPRVSTIQEDNSRSSALIIRVGGNYFFYNFAAVTPALPPADRQSFYGSFTRDLCDKYLTVFADFKYVRSFFDASTAAVPFSPDPFKIPGTNIGFSRFNISVPISNPFNPFTVADATIPNFFPDGSGLPVTTGVGFRGTTTPVPDMTSSPTGIPFSMLACVVRWENLRLFQDMELGNGLPLFPERGAGLVRWRSQRAWIAGTALLDTDPATAFDPFLNFTANNTKAARSRVYVTLHNSGEYELPIAYATINGDLFNLPAGLVAFALGGEYDAPRWTRDRDPLNTTFQSIGSLDGWERKGESGCWSIYQEVRGTLHQSDVGTSRLLQLRS